MPLTITASDIEFVTLSEVMDNANVTSLDHADELILLKDAAQGVVEGLIGPVLHRTVTETIRDVCTDVVVLRTSPVISVTSVTAFGSTLAGPYAVDSPTGCVYGLGARGSVTVTYVAGRTIVPDNVRVATLLIASHLWKTQQGASPSALQGDEAAPVMGMGYAIPNRAMDLLRPYLRPPTGIA